MEQGTKKVPKNLVFSSAAFISLLGAYQSKIEQKIKESLSLLGPKSLLRDTCEYALLNGGKRFRPALVYAIAETLGKGWDVSYAALAIEFFHTASLIADDLPCMDNDDERRNKPTTHKVYGEANALLASYGLIAAGYECIAKNALLIKKLDPNAQADHLCVLALENGTYNTGLNGATGGQFLDIDPPDLSQSTMEEVICKKTVSLFEIAFVLGWLFGGGRPDLLDTVKKAAKHFGMAFQIADDIGDVEQDKINGRQVNMAAVVGKEKARQMFHEELEQFQKTLILLNLEKSVLRDIGNSIVCP